MEENENFFPSHKSSPQYYQSCSFAIQENKLFFWGANASLSRFRDLLQQAKDKASKKAGSPHSFCLFNSNISL
ncbi:hypothetical protein H5410_063546 [Solanum commersonii]|uniref:Uncharacterized protein n=1 Tax=Solanum commersonii TaxID=4109 RepID=A0A9J5WEU6_SOLCO|nr:hypothetical protein H5410_063546 [Solanum commersonii]